MVVRPQRQVRYKETNRRTKRIGLTETQSHKFHNRENLFEWHYLEAVTQMSSCPPVIMSWVTILSVGRSVCPVTVRTGHWACITWRNDPNPNMRTRRPYKWSLTSGRSIFDKVLSEERGPTQVRETPHQNGDYSYTATTGIVFLFISVRYSISNIINWWYKVRLVNHFFT